MDGKEAWRFNSSVCEQQNAWLTGFQSILREMKQVRYDFYLDEMIRLHNNVRLAELELSDNAPYLT